MRHEVRRRSHINSGNTHWARKAMKIITTTKALRNELAAARGKGKTVGFVPTMGAFHQGHLSLIRRCKKENDICVVSIFVNPTQFGPKEDFKTYPRNKRRDASLARQAHTDILFCPSVKDIYPQDYLTYVNVEKVTEALCGKSRPGHFKGVATIVAKLLNIVGPNVLYLGQKDFQQCVVLQQMVRDLNFPVGVTICPTFREKDGLAMSSRNQYLSKEDRQEAPILYTALKISKGLIQKGARDPGEISEFIRETVEKNSRGKIDYIACVDAKNLTPLKEIRGKCLIALAVIFSRARLIDNILVQVK
jgi:pantoate--beta-alanine ligase